MQQRPSEKNKGNLGSYIGRYRVLPIPRHGCIPTGPPRLFGCLGAREQIAAIAADACYTFDPEEFGRPPSERNHQGWRRRSLRTQRESLEARGASRADSLPHNGEDELIARRARELFARGSRQTALDYFIEAQTRKSVDMSSR